MALKRGRPKKQSVPESPVAIPPIDIGGDVRVSYDRSGAVTMADVAKPVAKVAMQPLSALKAEGFLLVGKTYFLKDNWRVEIINRSMGPQSVSMITHRKGQLNGDNTIRWSPLISIPEKHVENLITNYKIREA